MVMLKDFAISVGELRSLGAGGYAKETLMVPYELAEAKVSECVEANKLLVKENTEWAKELEELRVENALLKKRRLP